MLRRFAPPLLALAVFACTPSVPKNPSTVDYAAFDPLNAVFPTPNELILQFASSVLGAQGELLRAFAAQGGFPYDQVLPVSIDLVREDLSNPTAPARSAPPLDLASIIPCTALTSPGSCNLLVLDGLATAPADQYPRVRPTYAAGASSGTLSLTRIDAAAANPATAPPITWRPGGNYIVALRGGPDGVKTSGGGQLNPSATMYTLLFSPRADLPNDIARQLQDAYQPAFAAVENRGFPKSDIAVLATFPVAPASTWVKADPATGDMPLPSDFLFDLSTGRVSTLLDPLIPNISTLDGFSTTAMVFGQTSGPIQAGTVRSLAARGVYLYDLASPSSPALVPDVVDLLTGASTSPVYAAVTSGPTVQGGLTVVVGLQPAVGVPVPPATAPAPPGATPTQVSLPPLKEKNRYAVVVTTGVLDVGGAPLSRTTLGTIVMLSSPICLPAGCSDPTNPAFPGTPTLSGVSAADAAGLESQRLALQPVLTALETPLGCAGAADPLSCVKGKVAFGYTFRTQTVTDLTLQLPMLPYAGGAFGIKPGAVASLTPIDAFHKHGVDPLVVTSTNIGEVLETTIPTVNLLDPITGAFDPDSANWRLKSIPATVVVPTAAVLLAVAPDCPAPLTGLKCPALVVFHHGLGGGRAQMLLVADHLAAKGFVVAAVDGPLHGDRSYCTQNSDCVLDAGGPGTCTPVAPPGTPQGDETPPPGTCTAGTLVKSPVLCLPQPSPSTCAADFAALPPSQEGGVAAVSGFYAVSANLYRTRDSIRQDLVDVSALALALARPPPPTLPAFPAGAESPVAVHLLGEGIFVNPAAVYYEGQSLGALLGTLHAAAQPQLSRAVLNVGGGTIGDILSQSPAFAPLVEQLLASLGISPGSPEYLLFLQTAKWILDPAEPINFAATARARRLPTPPAPLTHVDVLGQWAACDQVVPNTASALLYDNLGLGASGGTSTSVLYANSDRQNAPCVLGVSPNPGTLSHSFLADWGLGSGAFDANDLALTLLGQDDAATFLLDVTLPPPVRAIP
jgi:hypothetical protein